jgi:TOD1/MUCI70, glycosyltransferase-like domain
MVKKNTLLVYTCITGGKDDLKENQVTGGVPFYAFLDDEKASDVWRVCPAANLFRDPRRNARMHKILSHQFFPEVDYTVWIDGTITVTRDIRPLVAKLMAKCDMATFRHPERDCLYQEAEACKKYNLDDSSIIDRQMTLYRSKGVPENLGLFECNVLVRKNSPRVRRFNDIWWSELCSHSRRDQLSMAYAAREAGLAVGIIPGNAQNLPHINPRRSGNDYFAWSAHLNRL